MLIAEAKAGRISFNGHDALHVCAPVFHDNQRIGTLSIVWHTEIIDKEIRGIIRTSILALTIISITVGIILFYAYRKNKSNVKIAYYDNVTGLPNQVYFEEYLEGEITKAGSNKIGILLLNCTNSNIINITYGFKYGNKILKRVAENLKSSIAPKDMFFRLNADNFILVTAGYTKTDELTDLSQRLIDTFQSSFAEDKHEYLNFKVAILEIKDNITSADEVLQNVSQALDTLKNNTNKHIVLYNKEMSDMVLREDIIEKTLINIIRGTDKESFHLVFQPKLDIKTGRIAGFEALARMNIKGLGYVPPTEFIEIAEKRNHIFDFGNLIIEEAYGFLVKLHNSGQNDVSVAVNVSSLQLLRDEFIQVVSRIVNRAEVDLRYMEFEITESALIDNFDLINDKLAEIKKLGISTSLDDFGTGYSSFARLSELYIDAIKIDRHFIRKIDQLNEEELIITDIISMAHRMGLTVVAEGVENEHQKKYLEKQDCDIIQGYLISKPLSHLDAIIASQSKES